MCCGLHVSPTADQHLSSNVVDAIAVCEMQTFKGQGPFFVTGTGVPEHIAQQCAIAAFDAGGIIAGTIPP